METFVELLECFKLTLHRTLRQDQVCNSKVICPRQLLEPASGH